MPLRPLISSILLIGALFAATPALAASDPAWKIVPPKQGVASMTRRIDNVALAYARAPGDSDSLIIAVADCGDEPWSMEDSLNSVTAESLRASIAEEFENARLNCKVADGVEQRMMAGFDEAFARVKPFLAPHLATIGGWQLEDRGSLPGDDSERSLSMRKELQSVTMTYNPGTSGDSASFSLQFVPCNHSYSSGFDFGDPPEDHVKAVNEQVAEAYADLAGDCKEKPEPQTVLMQDFPEALHTIEQWLAAKPFIYPDEGDAIDSARPASGDDQ